MAFNFPGYRAFDEDITPDIWNADVIDNLNALYASIPLAVPPGILSPYAGGTTPTGWILCNGQAVSRSVFSALFTAIGTLFGVGNGTTTFNVPDMRGRVPLGLDNLGGSSANRVVATQADTMGQNAGEENHTLTTTEMPSHSHDIQTGNSNPQARQVMAAGDNSLVTVGSGIVKNTGGGATHNNMQPYISVSYIIKY